MKKLIFLLVIGVVGYVWLAYWQRLRREVDLHQSVKTFLETVPTDASELSVAQQQQLAKLVADHDFVFKAGSIRFTTNRTKERPSIDLATQCDYTQHIVMYTYSRPTTLLPFQKEDFAARTTQLVAIPVVGGTGAFSGSSAFRQSMGMPGPAIQTTPVVPVQQFRPTAVPPSVWTQPKPVDLNKLPKYQVVSPGVIAPAPAPRSKHKSTTRKAADKKPSKHKSSVTFKNKRK